MSAQPGSKPVRRIAFLAATLALVVAIGVAVAVRRSGSDAGAPADQASDVTATRVSEGGQVTIKATWQGAAAGPVFFITMDTHSVDLDGIDLRDRAVLRTGEGVEVRPVAWDAPKGGHHREGTLSFPATAAGGDAVIRSDTRALDLVIRDVAGVPERTFQWLP